MKALAKVLFLLFVGFSILAVTGGYVYFLQSVPKTSGAVSLEVAEEPIEVTFSKYGVPLIQAQNAPDAYMTLGYLHAQDRLWQMDMIKRLGQGRLSELVGEKALVLDKMMRAFDLEALAAADYEAIEVKDALRAYTRGVNAYIQHNRDFLPPEFIMLGHTPEYWNPEDSLLWGRVMALMLSNDVRAEFQRFHLAETLSPAQIRDLYPAYPEGAPVSIPTFDPGRWALVGDTLESLDNELEALLPELGGSNAWAVSGEMTETGKPILAGDPHLSYGAPGFWYLVRMEFPGTVLAGATMPGSPYVLVGHNNHVAWSMTTSYADTQDILLLEAPVISSTKPHTIQVRGEDPVTFVAQSTPDGPVLNNVLEDNEVPANGASVVLKSVALQPGNTTAAALQDMNWATSTAEFLAALKQFVTPSQNIVFAGTDGNIGMLTAGKIPLRLNAQTGFMPQTSAPQWTYIPFKDLPFAYNPDKTNSVINANNKPMGEDYPYFMGSEFQPPYRAQRIEQLLKTPIQWNLDDMATLQQDTASLMALDLLPLLLTNINAESLTGPTLEAYKKLNVWQGDMNKDAPEPYIFITFLDHLERMILSDKLPEDYFKSRRHFNPLFVKKALSENESAWCDLKNSIPVETCLQLTTNAFQTAMEEITNTYGIDTNNWRWADAHEAVFPHPIYQFIPLVGDLIRVSTPVDGGPETVNRQSPALYNDEAPYASRHGANLRAVFDLSNLDNSLFMMAPGQSGHLLSPHERDLLGPWVSDQYMELTPSYKDFRELSRGTLKILPK